MSVRAFVSGLSGLSLTADEAAFLRSARPAGIILFGRNIDHPDQVRRLVAEATAAIGEPSLVLIDQEGGRVQRLRPPHWRSLPSGRQYGRRLEDAGMQSADTDTRLVARLIAHDLRALGITCNCAPVLDLPIAGAHEVIGSRAFGTTANVVVALGRAMAEGLMAGGVVPVIKHIPGHGRAAVDTHFAVPTVTTSRPDLEASDFVPFKALADLPAAMTAHVIFTELDPTAPASISATVTATIIRGYLGFDGLLMSDDLSMQALEGTIRARAAAVLAAGSDLVLHCNGDLAEMEEVASEAPSLSRAASARFARALALTTSITPFDHADGLAALARVGAAASSA